MVRTQTCKRCTRPVYGAGPKRRWCDECETPAEKRRREMRRDARRRRDETPENATAGRTLECGCGKCGKTFVTKPGRQRVFAKDCPNRHRDRVAALRARQQLERDSAPLPDGVPFDRFRRVPDSPCQCGTGCGLTFKKGPGQRSRKFHPECPAAAERLAEKKRQYSRRQEEKKRAAAPPRSIVKGKAPDLTPRPRVKICSVCYNLPHARHNPKCTGCGLPFEPTPSLRNHGVLKKMPENTESKWR
jgi:hypothetical protein